MAYCAVKARALSSLIYPLSRNGLSRSSAVVTQSRLPLTDTLVSRGYADRGAQAKCGRGSDDTPPGGPDCDAVADSKADSRASSELDLKVVELTKSFDTERSSLNSKFDELQDRYRRSLAETENTRTRMRKQIDEAKLFAIQGFSKDLLEVADILSKAEESISQETLKESDPVLVSLHEGIAMTNRQLHKVFERHSLVPIKPEPVHPLYGSSAHHCAIRHSVLILWHPVDGMTRKVRNLIRTFMKRCSNSHSQRSRLEVSPWLQRLVTRSTGGL